MHLTKRHQYCQQDIRPKTIVTYISAFELDCFGHQTVATKVAEWSHQVEIRLLLAEEDPFIACGRRLILLEEIIVATNPEF